MEDYAFFVNSLVSLYEATFEIRWLREAVSLAGVMVEQFWDTQESVFYYTGRDDEPLIARTRDSHDGSIPSGSSMAALALLRLAKLTDQGDLREKAEATLHSSRDLLERAPQAAAQLLIALDFYLGPVLEFAIVGDPTNDDLRRVLHVIWGRFRPNKVTAFKGTGEGAETAKIIPLLEGKEAVAPVTIYICENYACQAPLLDARAVDAALRDRDNLKSPATGP